MVCITYGIRSWYVYGSWNIPEWQVKLECGADLMEQAEIEAGSGLQHPRQHRLPLAAEGALQ